MKSDATVLMSELPLQLMAAQAAAVTISDDHEDGVVPAELREWLVRLRLLEGVPFAYLVADTELLPPESIRFFYLDRRWTDALVQGALSVGTLNTDDRTQLTAQYGPIRDELDREERNLRRKPGTPRWTGGTAAISGFVLRSRAVSGWPGLHVRAFNVEPEENDDAKFQEDDPRRMRLLRLERLAPAVLLCLFDGIPKLVHIEEPRQGVQFGFDMSGDPNQLRATLRPRNATNFEYLGGAPIDVPFRTGSSGVVDIQQLERRLKTRPETGAGDGLSSAEYALQLVRFPFRQVFGDARELHPAVSTVFKATIGYAALADGYFVSRLP